jgi:hypothetical protein
VSEDSDPISNEVKKLLAYQQNLGESGKPDHNDYDREYQPKP